jgi:nucleoside-diphosphate-sugar epimerase
MNKTALLTGATGFIGSYLVRFLRSKGWKAIGSYDSRDSDSLSKLPNLHFV